MSSKPINIFNEKIRYLAIGDSIAEGFNSMYGVGFPGKMYFDKETNKNEISGMSYPAILAKMLNDISPNSIETFDNFCLTGTRISDWLYFLGVEPKKYNFKNSEKQILESKEYDRKENNPQRRRTYNQFGMFGINNKSDFDKLKDKIKKANFITITIGANDWITKFPFFEIMSLKNNILSKDQFDKKIDQINGEIFDRMKKFFKVVREINSTANIVVTGYPTTLPLLARLNNDELNKNSKNKIMISDYINLFNETILKVSSEMNVQYINFENKKYWAENIDDLSRVFFDIHPTYFGYKKIAHEIFAKITLSNSFYEKSFEEIKKIMPNINKDFFESDYKSFSNIIDFSETELTDESLIKISNIVNDKLFWSDNSNEKEFLSLKRSLTIKKYFSTDIRSSSYDNVKNLLNSFLQFIDENNFDPDKKINKILENKRYSLLLWEIIYKSDYLDIVVNQIQEKIDSNRKLKIETNLMEFKQIILSKLFDTSNIFLMLKDFSIGITKSGDKELLRLIEEAAISTLLNIHNSPKYNESLKSFIKNRAVDIILKRFHSKQIDLVEMLVDNFLEIKLELVFINLIKSYFESLDKIENLKSVNTFIRNFIRTFFRKIDMKLIVENIIGNEPLEYFLSEVIINIFELKNYTVQDVLLFKKFLKLLISKINNNDLIARIFSSFVTSYIDKSSDKNKQSILDFIWSSKSNEFWNMLKQYNIKTMWTNENDVFVLADVINLIFEKSSVEESEFYRILMNVKHPKARAHSLTSNLFSIAKDWVEKIYKIEHLYLIVANTLYNSFLEFKKINPSIKNEDNPYFKSYYRLVVSSLWVGYRLFQKDISINIFWNTKKGILKALPSISSQIYRLAMGNTKNRERSELVNYIFGDAYTKYLFDLNIDDRSMYKCILWYIQTSDLSYETENVKKEKRMLIINSLHNGYWSK